MIPLYAGCVTVTIRMWRRTALASYHRFMATISVTAAQQTLPAVLEVARTETVFLERDGRRVAVLLGIQRYKDLVDAYEELEDLAALEIARAEGVEDRSADDVIDDLGHA